ncbi:DUF4124 domain-containing protein [Shewanella sp. 10N.286.54.B9]|uniref:DUF4124 domain-containing protein n=1 Tax=Shewanella sp. 10N.286.54.B9 TaxID=3229719 RepID=UPI00354B1558
MRLSLLMLALLISPLIHATVYKWVDEDGKVHFSDEPVKNAEVVEFNKNTENQVKLPQPYSKTKSAQPPADRVDYTMRITSPSEEETIRSNEGEISIAVQLEPELASSHLLVLFMDGKQYGDAQQRGLFRVTNIDRGEHSFVIKALTQDGKLLASTPPRKVFLHRTIQNRAR